MAQLASASPAFNNLYARHTVFFSGMRKTTRRFKDCRRFSAEMRARLKEGLARRKQIVVLARLGPPNGASEKSVRFRKTGDNFNKDGWRNWLAHLLYTEMVVGSCPTLPTKFFPQTDEALAHEIRSDGGGVSRLDFWRRTDKAVGCERSWGKPGPIAHLDRAPAF